MRQTPAGKTRLLFLAASINIAAAAATLVAFLLLAPLFEAPAGIADPGARMTYWARLALWPAVFLFAAVVGTLAARGRSMAFNPIDDPETRLYRVNQRVLTNSVEQTLVFLPALAAFMVLAPLPDLGAARLATILFVLGRLLFWAGYLVHPYVRAPGMAMTLCVNVIMLGWAVLLAL